MVLLDTNVFVIDRFFPRDERYEVNKRFIAQLPRIEAGFCIFSLLELCGISSFNLSPQELKRWSYHFDDMYSVKILEPQGLYTTLAADWFARFSHTEFVWAQVDVGRRCAPPGSQGSSVLPHADVVQDVAGVMKEEAVEAILSGRVGAIFVPTKLSVNEFQV